MTNNETVFVLRVVKADMTSRRNPDIQGSAPFVWPESGPVEAPDWRDNDECGGYHNRQHQKDYYCGWGNLRN